MEDALGLVAERFPSVADMVITMRYFQRSAKSPLMVRTVNFFPTSYANFNMACMTRGCNAGGFELSPVIGGMVKTVTKMNRGSLPYPGGADTLPADHAHIEYEVVIRYQETQRSSSAE